MAVRGLMDVDHKLVLAQLDELIAMHTAPAYADVRRQLESEGLAPDFYAQMAALVAGYRRDLSERDNLQRQYRAVAGAARADSSDGDAWVRYVHAKVRQARARKVPEAEELATVLQLGEADGGTPVATRKTLDDLLLALDSVSSVAVLGLRPEKIEEGRRLAQEIPDEQSETAQARISREIETDALYAANEKLTDMLEELVATREAVEALHHTTLRGFELELLRSAAAPRSAPAPVSEVPAETPGFT